MICFSLLHHHIRPRQSRLLCLIIHYMPIGSDADHSGRAWYSLKVLFKSIYHIGNKCLSRLFV